jgi:hypothetical protein
MKTLLTVLLLAGVTAAAAWLWQQNRTLKQEMAPLKTAAATTAAELEKAQSEITLKNAQITKDQELQKTSATALAAAKEQNASLTAQLAKANATIARNAPPAEPASDMPVHIVTRDSSLTNGFVYRFKNDSTKTVSIKITFANPARTTRVFERTINPLLYQEIGHLEGWPGAAGDTVTIECPGYAPVSKTFN